jgi:hypothetical protein
MHMLSEKYKKTLVFLFRLIEDARGALTLEVVLLFPLYMFMAGILLWLGEVSYGKQHLFVADRYMAWNIGNRHRMTGGNWTTTDICMELESRLFPAGHFTLETQSVGGLHPTNKWWLEASAGVSIDVSAPNVVAGLLNIAAMISNNFKVDAEIDRLHARNVLSGQDADSLTSSTYEGHMLLMRSGAYLSSYRYQDPSCNQNQNILYDWEVIDTEGWPFE